MTEKGDEIKRRVVEQLQDEYRKRAERCESARDAYSANPDSQYTNQLNSLERDLHRLQRITLLNLRDRGTISDDVLRRFQLLLDLEEAQFEVEETR